jgi:adhesin transport system membrane fusion protein
MNAPHTHGRLLPPGSDHNPRGKIRADDLEYMHDISEALMAQATPRSSALLYLMVMLVISAAAWSALTEVDEVTVAQARVIPSSREQVVTTLEGGVLSELLVAEGAEVEKGQPLAQIDRIRFASSYEEGHNRELALKAAATRARAEAYGMPLSFPTEVAANHALVENERGAYLARRRSLDESVAGIQKSLSLLETEIMVSQRLAEQGLFSEVELSRLKRQANDAAQQINERRNRYRADANLELTRIEAELSQITASNGARLDSLRRTTLRAPVKGIVKNLRVTTEGSALPPSSAVMDIVPKDERLLFEARLEPKEIAHVNPDLPVAIRLDAYDPAIYGELEGKVELISPDTFRDDGRTLPGQESTYYRVLVRVEHLPQPNGLKTVRMIPGMTASAQIKTGKKTVLAFLLKPFNQAREAFRER